MMKITESCACGASVTIELDDPGMIADCGLGNFRREHQHHHRPTLGGMITSGWVPDTEAPPNRLAGCPTCGQVGLHSCLGPTTNNMFVRGAS